MEASGPGSGILEDTQVSLRIPVYVNQMGVKTIDEYIKRRQLSWAGSVARMDYERLPRKLLSSWVYNPRPNGSPQFTYARGLHRALAQAHVCI